MTILENLDFVSNFLQIIINYTKFWSSTSGSSQNVASNIERI